MVRRTTTTIIALGLLVASPLMARRLTTTQMRENTIRINALELEEPAPEPIPEPVPEPPKEETFVFDSGRLNFDFDKSVVKPQYFELLRNVKDYAEQNDLRLTIIGHTDSTGSQKHNLKLSETRAKNFARLMREFGLDKRFSFGKIKGEGANSPVDTDDRVEGRYNNRRVEILLNNVEFENQESK